MIVESPPQRRCADLRRLLHSTAREYAAGAEEFVLGLDQRL
ncbi:MAG: hypothetical protein WBQ45_21495 [Roseiarcus sp.]